MSVTKSSGVVDWTQQLHAGGVDLSAAAQANSDIEKEQEEDEEQEQEQEEDDDDEDDDDDQIEELEVTNVGEEERTVHKDFVTIGLVGM